MDEISMIVWISRESFPRSRRGRVGSADLRRQLRRGQVEKFFASCANSGGA